MSLRINTSAAEMISPDVPFRQHDKAYDAAFPDTEDRIVVVIDAPSPDQGDAAADRLAELMRGRSGHPVQYRGSLRRSLFPPLRPAVPGYR